MAAGPMPTKIAPEVYLEGERIAPYRSEYWLGHVYAMAGATESHELICSNISRFAQVRLGSARCRVFSSNMKVGVTKTRGVAYPDVTVTCGERKFFDATKDVLTNPTVIFEVLSESTRVFDQIGKWEEYQKLASLRHYVLVEQKQRWVRHYWRATGAEDWHVQTLVEPDALLRLAALGIELPLDEIYWEIELPPPEPDDLEHSS